MEGGGGQWVGGGCVRVFAFLKLLVKKITSSADKLVKGREFDGFERS